jgi:hypothetical protein
MGREEQGFVDRQLDGTRQGWKKDRSLADSGQWNMRFVIVMCLVPSVCELRCF